MKILVLSDSHGAYESMVTAYEKEKPDAVLYCGDGWRDFESLHNSYPATPMVSVLGNCDYGALGEEERLLEYRGKKIFLIHGHTRGCRYNNLNAVMAAKELGADVLLYGHTHRPLVDYDGSLFVMNPGTCNPRGSGTYGIITIEGEKLNCSTFKVYG